MGGATGGGWGVRPNITLYLLIIHLEQSQSNKPMMLLFSVLALISTVEPRYLELAYFELPFISK